MSLNLCRTDPDADPDPDADSDSTAEEDRQLDKIYLEQMNQVGLTFLHHTNAHDLKLCRKWVQLMAAAKLKKDKMARNYLSKLMHQQLTEFGRLKSPFLGVFDEDEDEESLQRHSLSQILQKYYERKMHPNRIIPNLRNNSKPRGNVQMCSLSEQYNMWQRHTKAQQCSDSHCSSDPERCSDAHQRKSEWEKFLPYSQSYQQTSEYAKPQHVDLAPLQKRNTGKYKEYVPEPNPEAMHESRIDVVDQSFIDEPPVVSSHCKSCNCAKTHSTTTRTSLKHEKSGEFNVILSTSIITYTSDSSQLSRNSKKTTFSDLSVGYVESCELSRGCSSASESNQASFPNSSRCTSYDRCTISDESSMYMQETDNLNSSEYKLHGHMCGCPNTLPREKAGAVAKAGTEAEIKDVAKRSTKLRDYTLPNVPDTDSQETYVTAKTSLCPTTSDVTVWKYPAPVDESAMFNYDYTMPKAKAKFYEYLMSEPERTREKLERAMEATNAANLELKKERMEKFKTEREMLKNKNDHLMEQLNELRIRTEAAHAEVKREAKEQREQMAAIRSNTWELPAATPVRARPILDRKIDYVPREVSAKTCRCGTCDQMSWVDKRIKELKEDLIASTGLSISQVKKYALSQNPTTQSGTHFQETIPINDMKFDHLLFSLFECNKEHGKNLLERDLAKMSTSMDRQSAAQHAEDVYRDDSKERLHKIRERMRFLTIIKKLFLETCVKNVQEVDCLLNYLDKEINKLEIDFCYTRNTTEESCAHEYRYTKK